MRRRPSYTLLELVLVVAVLVILSALSYPSIEGMYSDLRLKAGSDDVRAAWAQARSRAIDEARPYRFGIIPDQGGYRVAPDSPEFWNGSDPPTPTDGTNPPLILEKSLPRGIRFSDADASTGNGNSQPAPTGGSYSQPSGNSGGQGGGSGQASGNPDSSAYVAVVSFLPDGTASDDRAVTFRGLRGRPVTLHLRALTGAVTAR